MTGDKGTNEISLKEGLVLFPLALSAIAMTYDLGYWAAIDISLYTLFSVTEHLLFAFQAIPIALAATATIAMYLLLQSQLRKVDTQVDRLSIKRLIIVGGCAVFALIETIWTTYYLDAFYGTLLNLVGIAALAGSMFLLVRPTTLVLFLYLCGLILIIAYLIGAGAGRTYILLEPAVHTIQTATERTKGKIIRSGEKGVLFLLQDQIGTLKFFRWESIKEIDSQIPAPRTLIEKLKR